MPRATASSRAALLLALALTGCGASRTPTVHAPGSIDETTFAEAQRRYLELAPDAPERAPQRARLVAYLASQSEAVLQGDDYDEVVLHLRRMTALLAPLDFAGDAPLPPEIEPLARYVATRGARRGDEARVLAAELLLARLDTAHRTEHAAEYERVSHWGREARTPASSDVMAIVESGVGLVDVWEEHARLTPAPDVLDRLATVYVGLRDALAGPSAEAGFRPPRGLRDMEHLGMAAAILQRAPLEVAAIFLAQGDLPTAAARLGAMSERGGDTWHLRRLVEEADRLDGSGAQALFEIAQGFAEARPDVGLGLCRLGLRRFETDARFALCLARLATENGELGDMADYYARAVELEPERQSVYDEALDAIESAIEQGAFSQADLGESRTAGRAAHTIIAARALRFPDAETVLDQPTLHLALARAELAHAHTDEARAELTTALDEARHAHAPRAAVEAREELALIDSSLGNQAEAAALLTQALETLPQGEEADGLRARLLRERGDVARRAGDAATARAKYADALELLAGLEDGGNALVDAQHRVERGIVERRLGDVAASNASFTQALSLSAHPLVAVAILRTLVLVAPDGAFADDVLDRARVGSSITRSDKVRLALWTEAVHAVAPEPTDSSGALRIFAAEHSRGGWTGVLAGLARGDVDVSHALEAARTDDERCEAHFHAAVRLLRAGDRAAARLELEHALSTGVAGRDTYRLARELLPTL